MYDFTINYKSSFIYSFQFLSSSLDSIVTNLGKGNFKYLSQEFDDKNLIITGRRNNDKEY